MNFVLYHSFACIPVHAQVLLYLSIHAAVSQYSINAIINIYNICLPFASRMVKQHTNSLSSLITFPRGLSPFQTLHWGVSNCTYQEHTLPVILPMCAVIILSEMGTVLQCTKAENTHSAVSDKIGTCISGGL